MRCTLNGTLILCSVVACMALLPHALQAAKPAEEGVEQVSYSHLVGEAQPLAVWNFDGKLPLLPVLSLPGETWTGKISGNVKLSQEGPQSPLFPLFTDKNEAASFDGRGAFIRYADPGTDSALDFTNGDTITIEAWVNLTALNQDQQVYVIGKGRTNNEGTKAENQNYALRLRGEGGTARLSFLFRSVASEGLPSEYHRWNSEAGFSPGTGWRHIAVTYTFGEPKSIRGYLDGQPTKGSWDYGGETERAPVVDNDELWIGSSMGGNPGSSFKGELDGIAIYRHALSAEQVASHFKIDPTSLVADLPTPPEGRVLFEIIEGVTANSFQLPQRAKATRTFELNDLALIDIPKKYNDRGVIADYAAPLMIRAVTKKELPAGKYDILLRSFDGARLLIDGRPVAQTAFLKTGGNAHQAVPELAEIDDPEFYPPAIAHSEKVVTVDLGGEHLFQVEVLAGGKNNRPEIGELSVSLKPVAAQQYVIVSPNPEHAFPLTYDGWDAYQTLASAELNQLNRDTRRAAAANDAAYWEQRHETARQLTLAKPAVEVPAEGADLPANNEIDRFINAKLAKLAATPSALTDDYQFIRRVSLDIRGVVPTPTEIESFLADKSPQRRSQLIDRFLQDPRWADNWVPYWQDVLAENPGILKPMLNNTGPFRYWIKESFADNKPFDRFVTELLSMEGSTYYGGPGGFAMASQNDAPMAAKAHVAAQAFLGVEMKCARCHDAPYHPFRQSDLFEIAAMLDGKSLKLPASSTVPRSEGGRQPLVEISLKPGDVLKPQWPFADEIVADKLPDGFIRDENDTRGRLAALFTSPSNERFAEVIVNRMWQRYVGIGIVEPVDDWYEAEASHPELLAYLGNELVLSGYDLKHIARLILNSQAYQRIPVAGSSRPLTADLRSFAAPARRRLTAEQLVDSVFVAADKDFRAEQLNLDPDNHSSVKTFLNLGTPEHSWEFVSLSNERDRPALALPVAQSFVDALAMFGWRDSRQNPITQREDAPTALQPLTLGNGIIGNRLTTLSDDSAFTDLALTAKSPEALLDATTLRILARPATSAEHDLLLPLLREGFADRVVPGEVVTQHAARHAVSWSNHLSAEATKIKMELEEAAQRGDPPTNRLAGDWRERMEDVVWALANSPEFMFVP